MGKFLEQSLLVNLGRRVGSLGEVREEGYVTHRKREFPILSFHFGSKDPKASTLIFVAGVHGLEKIGTQILTAYLDSWLQLLRWDKSLQVSLENARVIFYPIVNPVGMVLNQRSNGNGVDLMRNAPVDSLEETIPLVSGHRISPRLPWYRGEEGLEREALILESFIRKTCFQGAKTLVLDIHSGFGLKDSLWFPYARGSDYFPEAGRVLAIKKLLDRTYPHHTYAFEPQHFSYKTHGDLWDYFLEEFEAQKAGGIFIPLTLEMGSWAWVKKNPRQIFNRLGLFNPILPHRVKRAERRHFLLFNFLVKVISSPEAWETLSDRRLRILEQQARRKWYLD